MTLIYPNDRQDAQQLARQLLDAAGEERHDEVRTTTDGALGLAFDVPDDLAQQVLGTGDSRVVQPSLETSAPGAGGAKSMSAAGADVSEVDAKSDGASLPSPKASRSRASRSG